MRLGNHAIGEIEAILQVRSCRAQTVMRGIKLVWFFAATTPITQCQWSKVSSRNRAVWSKRFAVRWFDCVRVATVM